MWHHHLPDHHHQIIHSNPRPLPSPASNSRRTFTHLSQLNADLPRPLQEKPQEIALLQPHLPTRQRLRLEEDKRQDELGAAHRFIRREVLFPERFFQRGFPGESRFGLRFGLHCHRARRLQALFDERSCGPTILVFFILCCCRGSRLLRFNHRLCRISITLPLSCLFFIFVAERKPNLLHPLLPFLETGRFGRMLSVLGPSVSVFICDATRRAPSLQILKKKIDIPTRIPQRALTTTTTSTAGQFKRFGASFAEI
jgi:hypothetical protein